eukprot:scaffold18729_cov66-Phaeocystis_antarctica.AAC.3
MPGSSTRHCVKASTGSSCAHARFLAAKLPPRAPKTHTRLRLGAMITRSPGFSMSDFSCHPGFHRSGAARRLWRVVSVCAWAAEGCIWFAVWGRGDASCERVERVGWRRAWDRGGM